MGGNVTFLQDVQDAYSQLAELAIVLIKKDGQEVTTVSNHSQLTKILYDQWGDKEHYQEFLQPIEAIQKPTVVDNRMGLKMIVAPIKTNSDCTYYFLAGYFLETSARAFIKEYVKVNFPDMIDLLNAIEFSEELTEAAISKKCDVIGKLVKTVETYFALGDATSRNQSKQSSSFMYQHLEGIRNNQVSASSFIEEMYQLYNEVDFIGLAVERENEQYHVDVIHGDNADQLRGHSFVMGEGFLGHTLAAEQFQFWPDVDRDPRVTFFKRHGIYPVSLFCVPIFQDDRIIAILFGGSTQQKIIDGNVIDQVKAHSSLLSVLVTTKQLRENLDNHLMELSTFNEVFRVMTTVKEIKRVLHILVDISLNIIRGPFACIVFKPEMGQSKVDIVSRGLTSKEITEYGQQVAMKVFSKTNQEKVGRPVQQQTSWGTDVLEFPLRYNDEMYGVLCVGLSSKNNPEKFKPFLSSLAVAGSISIHLCQKEKEVKSDSDDYIIKLLYETLRQQNKPAFELAEKVQFHVKNFTTYLNEGDYSTLQKVSGLIYYELPFLERYLSDRNALTIVRGCFDVLQKHISSNRESEVLALIYTFVNKGEKVESLISLENVNQELKNQFSTYIHQQTMIETVLSFDEEQTVVSDVEPTIEAVDTTVLLKKKLGLSSREIEVINYMLKGCNNRDIALNLFISEHTVKNHITRIFQKIGVSDRSQAIAMIYQLGYTPM